MATTKKMPPRPVKRAKAEVEREFSDLQAELAESRQTANPKLEEETKLRETDVRQSVEGVSVETVVQRMSTLSIEVARSLSGLSDQLIEEVRKLAALREAVEIEKRELTRFHQIDLAATSLDLMVQDYDRRKQELEREIETQREAWEEQTRNTERERKEQEESLRKQRTREAEEFEYKKALERKKAQDKYDEETRLLEKRNQDMQEALEKSWKTREAALKEQEAEIARLREEAAQFPARLEQELQRATAEAGRQADARVEHKMLVLRKDADADKRLAELRVKTLEDTVQQQAAQITALQKQLDEAKQQVQDIAVKAIEGASGSRALSHINQIAMEQAKHRSPQG